MSTPKYEFSSDTDTGFYYQTCDDGITSSSITISDEEFDISNTSAVWTTTTGTSGGFCYTPSTTGTSIGTGHYTFTPYIQAGISIVNDHGKYTVLELPESKIPNKVYLCGRLVTVGMLGSDVQAAYDGVDKLVISPGELNAIEYNNRVTISLDYGEWLYHYNVEGLKDDSNIILAKEVSKVKQR